MPYEGEEPPYVERPRLEPDPELDELTGAVIGAAIEVHRQLGPGLDEKLYESGMCVEFRLRKIPFARQLIVPVTYKGEVIGEKRLDLIVGNRIIVEIKAVEALTALHKARTPHVPEDHALQARPPHQLQLPRPQRWDQTSNQPILIFSTFLLSASRRLGVHPLQEVKRCDLQN
jgi:GxxExxY protein